MTTPATRADVRFDRVSAILDDGLTNLRIEGDRLQKLAKFIDKALDSDEDPDLGDYIKAWNIAKYAGLEVDLACFRLCLQLDLEQKRAQGLLSLAVQLNPDDNGFYTYRPDLWKFTEKAPWAEYGWKDNIHISWEGVGNDEGGWNVIRSGERDGRDAKIATSPLLRAALSEVIGRHQAEAWVHRVEREAIANVLETMPDA